MNSRRQPTLTTKDEPPPRDRYVTIRRRSDATALAAAGPDAEVSCHLMARNLKKSYHKAAVEIPVLRGVDLSVRRGEFLASWRTVKRARLDDLGLASS